MGGEAAREHDELATGALEDQHGRRDTRALRRGFDYLKEIAHDYAFAIKAVGSPEAGGRSETPALTPPYLPPFRGGVETAAL